MYLHFSRDTQFSRFSTENKIGSEVEWISMIQTDVNKMSTLIEFPFAVASTILSSFFFFALLRESARNIGTCVDALVKAPTVFWCEDKVAVCNIQVATSELSPSGGQIVMFLLRGLCVFLCRASEKCRWDFGVATKVSSELLPVRFMMT